MDRHLGHRLAALGIEIERRVEGAGERPGVARRHQKTSLAFEDGLFGAAMVEGDDRAAHRLGLDDHPAEGFRLGRGVDHHIRRQIGRRHVAAWPGKAHDMAEAVFFDLAFELLAVILAALFIADEDDDVIVAREMG